MRKTNPLQSAARCGAKCKRTGLPCRAPAMSNGRCRMHGGKSTGPKTAAGKKRIRYNALKHGRYTAANREKRRIERLEFRLLKGFCLETLDILEDEVTKR